MLENKVILVTGGTGSLGKTLVKRLMKGELGKPKKIVIFSRDEAKQHEMKVKWKHLQKATDEIFFNDFEKKMQLRNTPYTKEKLVLAMEIVNYIMILLINEKV